MDELKKLRELAQAAGGDKWEESDADGYVFGSDGDSVCICHANMGGWREPIFPEHRAAFIAAANPAAILSLLERLEKAEAVPWISLADRKPPEWAQVLVALDTGIVVTGFRGSAGWQWDDTSNEADAEATATHWMPFPAHPAAVAQLDKQEKQ
jgi:hypothetical protein